jgi:glutamate/tyrosine decarboxylase-like PLP-dependent enzyme
VGREPRFPIACQRPVDVQICWEKFARYWDVEMRLVPVSADATYLSPEGSRRRLR